MSCCPDISVIVPTYNSGATLSRALDSLIAQKTGATVEILISDDGSTDNTVALSQIYAEKYPEKVRMLTAVHNRGVVTNYFDAFNQCRGRYITDCAADDFWLEGASLDKKYRVLESAPDADAVYSAWMEVMADGSTILRHGFGKDIMARSSDAYDFMLALLRRDRPVAMHLSTVLYRADIMRDALARRKEMICNPAYGIEDLPIMLALAANGNILYDETPSLGYTVGHASISNGEDAGCRAMFSIRCSIAVLRLALYYGIAPRLIRKSMQHHLTYALGQARRSHDRTVKEAVVRGVEECGVWPGMKGQLLKWLDL